ncbi:Zinc finger CCCH domain-containing protein 17 [Euphorbia peplus]|nr:Zinc finger CCCH domain-containing protein 17 [Euphorbia peplus]
MDTKFVSSHPYGGGPAKGKVYSNVVCHFWLAGKCNRNPCRFLHRELPTSNRGLRASVKDVSSSNLYNRTPRQSNHVSEEEKVRMVSNYGPKSSLAAPQKRLSRNNMPVANSKCNSSEVTSMETSEDKDIKKPAPQNSAGDWFRLLAELKGHTKGICGIALPSGSDKLYSASNDGMVHVWDCRTGKSTRTTILGERIGCLIGEGSWVFVGLQNSIKAWNCATQMEYTLDFQSESFGLVYAMDTTSDMLFSGGQGGVILAWKASNDNLKPFKLVATMKGHAATVTCLRAEGKRLFSGSTDGTIRMWDVDTLKCLQLLKKEHTDVVRSLICWGQYLISCSLDKTIKVWGGIEVGMVEVIYSHDINHGAIALCGILDQEKKPVLMCSCNDGSPI